MGTRKLIVQCLTVMISLRVNEHINRGNCYLVVSFLIECFTRLKINRYPLKVIDMAEAGELAASVAYLASEEVRFFNG